MPKKAFLFDVDGVLVATHELQAIAMKDAMTEVAQKYSLDFQSEDNLKNILLELFVGGTEKASIKKFFEDFPVFVEYQAELLKCAWQMFYALVESSDYFKIEDTINTLMKLKEGGHAICLVSNSKRKDIERYCGILKCDFIISEGLYVGLEDVGEQVKPSPTPYLVAAKKLNVSPDECVVFEDSGNGVTSGKSAGMYVVGLHKYPFPEKLSSAGADEVINNISSSKILIHFLKSQETLSATLIMSQTSEESKIGTIASDFREKMKFWENVGEKLRK